VIAREEMSTDGLFEVVIEPPTLQVRDTGEGCFSPAETSFLESDFRFAEVFQRGAMLSVFSTARLYRS
jgi:hypothetical protein